LNAVTLVDSVSQPPRSVQRDGATRYTALDLPR